MISRKKISQNKWPAVMSRHIPPYLEDQDKWALALSLNLIFNDFQEYPEINDFDRFKLANMSFNKSDGLPVSSAIPYQRGDNQFILTTLNNGTVKVWKYNGKEYQQDFESQRTGYADISATPFQRGNNYFILIASRMGPVEVWKCDGKNYLLDSRLPYYTYGLAPPTQYEIGNDHFILTASNNGAVEVWKYAGKNYLRDAKLSEPVCGVNSATLHQIKDDHFILITSMEGTAKVWKRHGNEYQLNSTLQEGHTDYILKATHFERKHDRLILTASMDGTAIVWKYDGTKYQQDTILRGHLNGVTFCTHYQIENDYFILTGSDDATVNVWKSNDKTYKLESTIQEEKKGNRVYPFLSCTPFQEENHHFIVTTSMDNTVQLWKRIGKKYKLKATLEAHEDWVTSVTEYKIGKDRLLLTKGNDDRAYVWEKYRLTAKQTPKDPCQKQKRNRVSNFTS